MRIFKSTCIDSKTNMEMVLSDASYNNAAWYIDNLARVNHFRVLGTETVSDLTKIICTAGITFYYDEARGYLLKEVA